MLTDCTTGPNGWNGVDYSRKKHVCKGVLRKNFSSDKKWLKFPVSFAIMQLPCGYSSSVECKLPKLERWVRFPLPAPTKKPDLSAGQIRFHCVMHAFGACVERIASPVTYLQNNLICGIILLNKLEFGGESPPTMRYELLRSNGIPSRPVASLRSAHRIRQT